MPRSGVVPRVALPTVVALGAVVLVGAALRAAGAGYGLPYPLLDPDEGNVVPRAWDIVHGGGLDPGWYDYPSLLMLLLAPTQIGWDEPSYGAARVVAVGLGVLGIVAAWLLGRVAYGRPAGLVAAAAVAVSAVHVAYSRVAVTDVLLTLGVTVALALLLAGRLEWAGAVAGLATSAKYPGVVLVVPLAIGAWGSWRRFARSAVLGAVAFALTSPFVLLHAGAARDDLERVQRLARAGWLGLEDDPIAPLAWLDRLWDATGPLLVVAAAGTAVAVVRRERRDLVLLGFLAAYALVLVPVEARFDRYVLPLVPVLAVLAARTRPLAPLALAALLVPLAWSIGDARELGGRDTRLAADAWIAAHVPAGDRIAADPSTLPLAGRDVVRLELPGPGRPHDPRRDLAVLRSDGVRWLLVGGAVADRVLAAPDDYPREVAFYRAVRAAPAAYAAGPEDPGLSGPWVRVVRIYP